MKGNNTPATAKGFTLVELIVVIAIIGILAGFLVPSMIGYIGKAQRRVDATNAKVMYDDIMMILYTDDTLYDGHESYGVSAQQTAMQSWNDIPPTGSTTKRFVTVNTAEGTESYYVCVGCYMDSYLIDQDTSLCWHQGNVEREAFAKALNSFEGYDLAKFKSKKKSAVPIRSKSHQGKKTTRWYLCWRQGDPMNIEIWVGDSTNSSDRSVLYYRLYPETCTEYK